MIYICPLFSNVGSIIYCHEGHPAEERDPEMLSSDQCRLWRGVMMVNSQTKQVEEKMNCAFVHLLDATLHTGRMVNQTIAPLHQIRNAFYSGEPNGSVETLPSSDEGKPEALDSEQSG